MTGARVRRLETNAAGLVTGATWLDRDGGEHFEPARVVVLAANAIGTPRLLLLSASPAHPDGLANSSGLVGRRLMMHPFANVAGCSTRTSRAGRASSAARSSRSSSTRPTSGAASSAAPSGGWPRRSARSTPPCRAGPDRRPGARTTICTSARTSGAARTGACSARTCPTSPTTSTLSATLTDSSGIPAPEIHYAMSENSRRLLDFHIERASESLLEAGAHTIEVDRLMRYSGWHLLGTARMGDDPTTSVLDRWNRAHDVPNLYVVDGSCFVTSSGVNPTSSICALALRAADHMVETRFNQQVPV